MDETKLSTADATSHGVADKVPSPMQGDTSPAKSPVDQESIVIDESTPMPRPLYVASDILQPEPPPNLDSGSPPMSQFRLVPVTDEVESSATSSPSTISHRPSPQPLPEKDEPSPDSLTAHGQTQSLLIGPTPMTVDMPGETPIPPPPDTPLNQVPETPRQHMAMTRSSLPPEITPRSQLNDHRGVKSESPGIEALRLPPENLHSASRHQSNPPPPAASTSSSHSRNLSAPGPLTLASARRTTRGSLAAAAEAAKQPKFNVIAPGPGGGFQVSHNTYLVTQKQDWVLPDAQFGVSLAQIIPSDCQPKPWMRFTRHPIVWDGRTDAGGKTGKKLMVAPTVAASDPAAQDAAALEGGRLDGLHMLMDYRENERPIYSYALMTRFAILGSPYKSLSLAEIYVMLEAKFPYFEHDQSKWRDSIRYNLSSNRWFVKTKRQLHQPGVGNLWKVDETSPGGPKRPRNRQRNGTAFADADDDEDDDFDEEVELAPKESTTRNGTLMLTFDSKQPVPVDKRQADRAASGHAQHHQISRVTPRPSDEPPTTSSWSSHHPSDETGPISYIPVQPNPFSTTSGQNPPSMLQSTSSRGKNNGGDDVTMEDSEPSGDDSSAYDEVDIPMARDVEMEDDNARAPKNPMQVAPAMSGHTRNASATYHPSLTRPEQPAPPLSRSNSDPRSDEHPSWRLKGDGSSSSRSSATTASLPISSTSVSRSATSSKPLAPAPTASNIFSKSPIAPNSAQPPFSSLRPGIASAASQRSGSPTLPAQTPRALVPAIHPQFRSLAQLPSRDATRTPPRSTTPSRAGSSTPPRPEGLPLRSPYTLPPLPSESRKRKLLTPSPSTSRMNFDDRHQKVRRVEEAGRQRRLERPDRKTNAAFGTSSHFGTSSGTTGLFGGSRAALSSTMPPPPLPGSSRAQNVVGFATNTTSRSFTTLTPSSRFPSTYSTNSGSSTTPSFGQSGMMLKRPSATISIPERSVQPTTNPSSAGSGFSAFGNSQRASFFPAANSQQSGEGMEVDTDEEETPRSRTRTTSIGSRMEMDKSDEDEDEEEGSQSTRHQAVATPDGHPLTGRMPAAGMFAQLAARSFGSSLSVSVPVSSSRMERGPPTPQDSTMQSPTTPQSQDSDNRLTQSSRLPSINALPHQSSPPNYSSSLPPIPDLTQASTPPLPSLGGTLSPTQPAPPPSQTTASTQPILPTPPRTASPALPTLAAPSRPSAPDDAASTPARPVYFGFILMNHPVTTRSTRPPRKWYNGGDEDDNPRPVRHSGPFGWRD